MAERRDAAEKPGVADQNVELAMPLIERRAEPVDRREIRDVEGREGGRAAGRADLVVELLKAALGASGRDHMRPGLGERERRRVTDAAARAGDDRDAAGEGFWVGHRALGGWRGDATAVPSTTRG